MTDSTGAWDEDSACTALEGLIRVVFCALSLSYAMHQYYNLLQRNIVIWCGDPYMFAVGFGCYWALLAPPLFHAKLRYLKHDAAINSRGDTSLCGSTYVHSQ